MKIYDDGAFRSVPDPGERVSIVLGADEQLVEVTVLRTPRRHSSQAKHSSSWYTVRVELPDGSKREVSAARFPVALRSVKSRRELTAADAAWARTQMRTAGWRITDCASQLGVHPKALHRVLRGRRAVS